MKKKILLYAGIVLFFLVLSYGFVPQVLSGKIVNQSDISGWAGMSHEMMEWNDAHPDDQTAWTGSMFGGMPTTTIHASTKGDWTQKLYDLLLTGKRPATYLFISLLGAFLLMLSLGISPLVAIGGAIAVTFCAYNFQIIQVGHNTKMQALAFLPWVLAAVIFTYRSATRKGRFPLGRVLVGAALFGLALSFQIKANHPQISYYLALMIVIYVVALFIGLLRSEERGQAIKRFFVASALLLVLGCAGIATNAVKLLPTWEYTPYSMRGGSTAAAGEEGGKAGSKGLDLAYATAWSYGWQELPNLLVPNFNGGASAGAVNPRKSETYALLKKAGQPNVREVCKNLPLYWGPQPFTAGPMYMGAITVFLFLLGLMLCSGREKWWLLVATLFAVLLAVGNHFMGFTRLCFNVLPMYNKFRTVSMALTVLQFTLPMLAFLTLDKIVKADIPAEKLRKKSIVALAIAGGFCLLFVLIPSLAGTFSAASDSGQPEVLVDALVADRMGLLRTDAWHSLILVCATFALIYWGYTVPKSATETFRTHPEFGQRRRLTAAMLVCFLVLVDMFVVGKRYLNADHFITPKAFNGQFAKRPVDEMILADTDPSYRVLDLTVNVFNDSHPSYWHKNIGGYSPAKLQRYQEYIDSHLTSEINSLYKALQNAATVEEAEASLPYCEGLAALNCRYIIVGDDVMPLRYPHARGAAWFEDESAGSIEMTSYAPNEIRYSYSSENGGVAVFSEVYYPEGWVARIDDGAACDGRGAGESAGVGVGSGAGVGAGAGVGVGAGVAGATELPIKLWGDLFRSIELPAGDHEIVMRFEPTSYSRGEAISRASSILLLLVVLLAVVNGVLSKADARGQQKG